MVNVAVRAGPLVDATLNCTSPLPLPLAPDEIVTHGALLVAVHAHPSPAVTPTLPVPPPDGTDWLCGEIANVQPWVWATVTCCPAIVNVPERAGPLVADTAKLIDPDP